MDPVACGAAVVVGARRGAGHGARVRHPVHGKRDCSQVVSSRAAAYPTRAPITRSDMADACVHPLAARSKFGLLFQSVAEKVHANYRMTWFDTSVMEMAAKDCASFVEQLYFHMTSADEPDRDADHVASTA